MRDIDTIIQDAIDCLPADKRDARLCERSAAVLNSMATDRNSLSAAIIWFASEVYKRGAWVDPEHGDFESFDLWLQYAFDGTKVKRGTTIWTMCISFATGLRPWLDSHVVADQNGEIITAKRLITKTGYSIIGDINTAWWSLWKKRQELRDEGQDAGELTDEIDTRLTECVQKISEPGIARDGDDMNAIDYWLKEKGWRKSRSWQERLPYAMTPTGTGEVLAIFRCPSQEAADQFEHETGRMRELGPQPLDKVAPELIINGNALLSEKTQGQTELQAAL